MLKNSFFSSKNKMIFHYKKLIPADFFLIPTDFIFNSSRKMLKNRLFSRISLSRILSFPLRERSERVGLSACVKHGHVVQSTNCY